MKGDSKQTFFATIDARAKCYRPHRMRRHPHDNGANETMPSLKAGHPDAELTHEASIGKIANDQLMKLMTWAHIRSGGEPDHPGIPQIEKELLCR
jgi:hypothetical protein